MTRQVQEVPSPTASTIDHINRHGASRKAMPEDQDPNAPTPGHDEADQPTPSMIDASAMTPALNGIDSYAGWDVEDADEEVLPPGPSSALYDWSVDNEMHETLSTGWSALVNETLSPAAIALSLNPDQLQSFYSTGFDFMTSIPPAVQYSATADQFSLLLDRYDQEFCTYPITSDLDINPFRYRRETSRGSKHLLHAIIALACHHRKEYRIDKTPPAEFYQHKNQAVTMYKAALQTPEIQAQSLGALDTLLALWCIDTVESALNSWRNHLTNAYALLELAGGILVWSLSFRSQTQVTMLLWWDAVVALLSRRVPVMPFTYFEAVLQWETSQFWTFFDLIGCPRELLVPLMQFAHLAGQSGSKGNARKAMRAIVAEIETNLHSYRSPVDQEALLDNAGEESLQPARDRYHCCEAIRHSLMIYALRVFPEDKADLAQTRARLRYLSRISLDHVASIRASSDTLKQLLLPIFLAGAETNMERHKNFIREYCKRWFEVFGYHMFPSVLEILEEVWASREVLGDDLWWGDVIDARRRSGEQDGDLDFCFG
ncbi:hypothetical protein H2202_005094 [Exophiala xenobiotica]|nr:hypothetical protein H2202_005094 [Exophiala xenobiotica]